YGEVAGFADSLSANGSTGSNRVNGRSPHYLTDPCIYKSLSAGCRGWSKDIAVNGTHLVGYQVDGRVGGVVEAELAVRADLRESYVRVDGTDIEINVRYGFSTKRVVGWSIGSSDGTVAGTI